MTRIGTRVLYKLTNEDVKEMNSWDGAVNPQNEGDVLPGVIVADWGDADPNACVNISVTTDGNVTPLWKTSVYEGTAPGTYAVID